MSPQDQPDYIKQIQQQRKAEAASAEKAKTQNQQTTANDKVVGAINNSTKTPRTVNGSVEVTNLQEIAKTGDVAALTDAINKLNLTTFANKQSPAPAPALDTNLSSLSATVEQLRNQMERQGLQELATELTTIVAVLKDAASSLKGTKISVDGGLQKTIDNLSKQIGAIDFKPVVSVAAPKVTSTSTVDLKPLLVSLGDVQKAIANQKFPPAVDIQPVLEGLQGVNDAITGLRFPVANPLLPFQRLDPVDGLIDTKVILDANGNVPTAGSAATLPTTLISFITTVTTAGTRVQLASNALTQGAVLQAPSTNAGLIYIGGATVSSTVKGAELLPGQQTGIAVINTNAVYIDAATNGDKLMVIGS